ncbi:crotonase/enoyl-CoA hydratase family protein [Sphingomonas montanisoli]|uniref:Crotonase/enoyl-CoA hydratase family protein n=1 Tax=Sphingomonas montanisoli TaxID=2606412 RepID=A0A5D9C3W6_9SPHN|nr:crotonase/enoyl-CoA hydratase family protein [Sphingomonas montanisoli]TZG24651.1 crotonase/enoyl-CoA hydratase family protein [Sphingomonas montanisoli]
MSPFLIVERDGPVVTATLNRPEQRNALTTDTDFRAIVDFCAEVSADRSVRAVILTGAGSAFCAGGNVKDMKAREGLFKGNPYELRDRYRTGIQQIPLALWELEVPVIAAINGPAVGAGLDLACMCDIRIASRSANFAHSFAKLGLVPGDGGAWLLPRVVGQSRAAMMTLTGDTIDAATALDYGLVGELAEAEALLPRARAIADRIAANPGHATRLSKRLMREAQDLSLKAVLELSAAYQALAHHTRDHVEAVDAFLERRPPRFEDR